MKTALELWGTEYPREYGRHLHIDVDDVSPVVGGHADGVRVQVRRPASRAGDDPRTGFDFDIAMESVPEFVIALQAHYDASRAR